MTDDLEPRSNEGVEPTTSQDQDHQAPPQGEQGASVVDVINVFADRADELIKLAKSWWEQSQETKAADRKYQIRLVRIVAFLVTLMVGVAAWLTYADKVPGSTLSFLLGTIVGYLLTFVQNAGFKDRDVQ